MKRVVSLLLILCFLFVALMACGEVEETQAPTEKPTESQIIEDGGTIKDTDEYSQNLFIPAINPDEHDYDGETINILCRNSENLYREFGKESVGDDTLDQAIKARNDIVAEGLNVVVNVVIKDTGGFEDYVEKFNSYVKNDVEIGLHEYDAVAAFAYAATNSGIREYLANLMDTDEFPHFAFDKPCWNQSLVDEIVVNDRLYVVAGDLNLSMFDSTMMVWCNKTLYNNLKDDADPDIQELALSKTGWTYADLYNWAQLYTDRPNTEKDCQDFHGWSMTKNHYDSCLPAWDIDLVKKNNDGTYSYNIYGNNHAEEAMEVLRDLIKLQGTVRACECGTGLMGHFTEGDILFCQGNLYSDSETNLKIRNMADEYCILPLPKYDEKQESYGTISQMGFNIMSVIDHSGSDIPTKGEAVSAYFQYANETSYTDVRGYYFEKIVKAKYFGADDTEGTVTNSQKIFELILDTVSWDVATIYSPVLNDITWLWKDLVELQGTLESSFKSNSNSGRMGGGSNLRTEAEYEAYLKIFNDWMFAEN